MNKFKGRHDINTVKNKRLMKDYRKCSAGMLSSDWEQAETSCSPEDNVSLAAEQQEPANLPNGIAATEAEAEAVEHKPPSRAKQKQGPVTAKWRGPRGKLKMPAPEPALDSPSPGAALQASQGPKVSSSGEPSAKAELNSTADAAAERSGIATVDLNPKLPAGTDSLPPQDSKRGAAATDEQPGPGAVQQTDQAPELENPERVTLPEEQGMDFREPATGSQLQAGPTRSLPLAPDMATVGRGEGSATQASNLQPKARRAQASPG